MKELGVVRIEPDLQYIEMEAPEGCFKATPQLFFAYFRTRP
jgi:hypothetical protein